MVDKKSKPKEKPKQKPVEKDCCKQIEDISQALNTMAENVHDAFKDVYNKLDELNNRTNKVSDRLGL
tara:strand:- start:134 stop:334 length:201 start_codon:yes stop_codon:yes gene_type:complete